MKRLFALGFVALATMSCDPVHDQAVADLGPEAPGVRIGPEHRPGQPCLVCHGGSGPGPEFTVGGTVYKVRGQGDPFGGVIVELTDGTNVTKQLATNGAGNFYASEREWKPNYPVRVKLIYADDPKLSSKVMHTHTNREGSCAACHTGAEGPGSPGPVYYYSSPDDVPQ